MNKVIRFPEIANISEEETKIIKEEKSLKHLSLYPAEKGQSKADHPEVAENRGNR